MTITMTQRTNCRVCGSAAVRRFLDFPDYPLSDNHLDRPDSPREFLARYQAYWCAECHTVQNLTDFDWSDYYTAYDYTVSTSAFARQFMDRLAANLVERYGLRPGAAVVEIGSGDGFQLGCFQRRGMRVFGYEPAQVLATDAIADGVPTTTALCTPQTLGELPMDLRPVQIFVSLYTLDHLPDPLEMLQALRGMLEPRRGLVVVEVHDLEQIVARREACLFCHEHTIYLSRTSLGRLMQRAGLRLIDVDLVPVGERRGNSLLAVAAHSDSPLTSCLPPDTPLLRDLETWDIYDRFGAEVAAAHARLAGHVRERIAAGQRVAGYGASARAISTLALAGLTHAEIAYVCDANPSLHGRYLPKSHVPIRPPGQVLADPVDEVIVFAYGYMDEICADLRPYLERGGRLVSLLDLLRA